MSFVILERSIIQLNNFFVSSPKSLPNSFYQAKFNFGPKIPNKQNKLPPCFMLILNKKSVEHQQENKHTHSHYNKVSLNVCCFLLSCHTLLGLLLSFKAGSYECKNLSLSVCRLVENLKTHFGLYKLTNCLIL